MATYTGTVRHNDLEGGFFELVTDKGEVLRLVGGQPTAGQRVRVTGKVERGGFGIHMSGPSLSVDTMEPLD